MDFQTLEPTYLAGIEAEQNKKRILELEEKVKKLENVVVDQRLCLDEERKDNDYLRNKIESRKYEKATKIRGIYRQVSPHDNFIGLVITPPIEYTHPTKRNHPISTINWVYSNKLGLVRSMNKEEDPNMLFGKFYNFKVSDDRDRMKRRGTYKQTAHMEALRTRKPEKRSSLRRTEVKDGKLIIRVHFEIDAKMLYRSDSVCLQDEYLNYVHLPTKMIDVIHRVANQPKLHGPLIVGTHVKVKENFLRIFEYYENKAVFEIEEITAIRLGDGPLIKLGDDN